MHTFFRARVGIEKLDTLKKLAFNVNEKNSTSLSGLDYKTELKA